jgi:hypothetical protein
MERPRDHPDDLNLHRQVKALGRVAIDDLTESGVRKSLLVSSRKIVLELPGRGDGEMTEAFGQKD